MDAVNTMLLFMFFFFLGFVAMFYHLLRRLDSQCQLLSDEHAQLRVLLRAMESRIDRMERGAKNAVNAPRPLETPDAANPTPDAVSAGHDPLLHLSFEKPASPELKSSTMPDLQLDPPMQLSTGKNI